MSLKSSVSLKTRLALEFAYLPAVGHLPISRYLRRKYGDRVVTPLKVENFIRAQRERIRKAVEVDSLPYVLNLDTFNGCNLKCPFCSTGIDQQDRAKARMSVERATRIIDQVKEHVLEVRLYNWGEPLLNPDIFEIIRHAHDAGIFTIVNSNLSVRVENLARKIVESKLDVLQASVDGLEQETLEIYRRRAEAQLIFDNVRQIAAERRRLGVDHPRIDLAFLVFRHNEHELPILEAKRREIGADRFFPRRAFIYDKEFIPRHADFQPMQALFEDTCDYLYSELTVEADGGVSPCCANTSSRWDLGRMHEIGDVRTVWDGPTYRAMRAFTAGDASALALGRSEPILCQTCDFVEHPRFTPGLLSPLPPGFRAEGKTYEQARGTAVERIPIHP